MTGSPLLERDLKAAVGGLAADRPSSACPPDDRLIAIYGGSLSGAEEDAVREHLAFCPSCVELGEDARRFLSAMERGPAASVRSGSRTLWYGFSAAAGLLLAAGVAFYFARVPEPPSFRLSYTQSIQSLLEPGHALPRSACVLRWTAPPAGARYSVHVTDEDLNPIATATGLEREEFTVPVESLLKLPSGSRLLWRVEAFYPDGHRVTSPTFINRLDLALIRPRTLADCDALVRSYPDDLEAYGCYHWMARVKQQAPAASRRLHHLLSVEPQNYGALLALARIEADRAGEGVEDLFRRAAEGFAATGNLRGEVEARLHLFCKLAGTGRPEEAAAETRPPEAADRAADPELQTKVLFHRGIQAYHEHDLSRALSLYSKSRLGYSRKAPRSFRPSCRTTWATLLADRTRFGSYGRLRAGCRDPSPSRRSLR
jgi:hypothetical protein